MPKVVDGLDMAGAAAGADLPYAVHEYVLLQGQRERKTHIVQDAFKKLPDLELLLERENGSRGS